MPRGRDPADLGRQGAEGATAPETLRLTGPRQASDALESGSRTIRLPTEGVTGKARRESLRFSRQRGHGTGIRLFLVQCSVEGRCPPKPRSLRRTPLHDLHVELGARMVPFAGYAMPVQYEGILVEHRWTREQAGLFDVSHMGQRFLAGPDHETTAAALEALTPGDFKSLKLRQMRYTLLLTDSGGIVDDLMVTRSNSEEDDGVLGLVFNAGRKEIDDAYIEARLPAGSAPARRRPRAARAAGTGGGGGDGPPLPEVGGSRLHDRDQRRVRRDRLRRVALRLYRRGRLRDLRAGERGGERSPAASSASRRSSRSGSARAIRCASKPACRSTVTTSTRRRRRSKPISPSPSPSGGAPRAALPGADRILNELQRRTVAQARRHQARRPCARCARARRSSTPPAR